MSASRHHHRRLATVATAAVLVLGVTACGGSSGGATTTRTPRRPSRSGTAGAHPTRSRRSRTTSLPSRRSTPTSPSRQSATSPTTRSTRPCVRVGPRPRTWCRPSPPTTSVSSAARTPSSTSRRSSRSQGSTLRRRSPRPARLHAVQGRPVLVAAPQRRLRPLLQQGDVREGRHHCAAETLSEFDADAVKLTKSSGDSYSQLGFMPNYHFYESTITHFAPSSTRRTSPPGQVHGGSDPGLKSAYEWQRKLVDSLGGSRSSRSTAPRLATSSEPRTPSWRARSRCSSTASGAEE